MTKSKVIAAIDVGSSKVTTLVAQINKDESLENTISVVGVSSVESKGVKKGQIVDIEEAVDSIIACVEGAERMAGYNLESAYVALCGAHLSSQNSHGVVAVSNPNEEIITDDVERVIEAASAISLPNSREIIHILPKEFIVDGESGVKDPIGMSGIRLEVDTHLVTASTSAVKNLRKAINEVGVNINSLVYSGLAASHSVLTKTDKELGCILIDIGGGTTSMAVYVDGSLVYSSVIPIGAKNVTNDLAIGLRLSLDWAEKIKISLSDEKRSSKVDKDELLDLSSLGVQEEKKVSKKTLIEGIIRPRLNEIFTMVKIQIEKEGLEKSIPSGAILTGGGALTAGIIDCARRTLGLPVRIGNPRGLSGLIDDIINPAYAVSSGLLSYAVKKEDEGLTIGTKKVKLPTGNVVGKVVGFFKDLLP